MTPAPDIEALIGTDDSIEIIRRSMSDFLVRQREKQKTLALAGSGDPALYDFRVFEESTNPISGWDFSEEDTIDRRPVVNVSFSGSSPVRGSSSVSSMHVLRSIFHVDTYAIGLSYPDGLGGHVPADSAAGISSIWAASLVRRILLSGQFTYGGLRGLVRAREPGQISTFVPAIGDRAIERVRCVRMEIAWTHTDTYQEVSGQPLQTVFLSSLTKSGEVVFQMQIGE